MKLSPVNASNGASRKNQVVSPVPMAKAKIQSAAKQGLLRLSENLLPLSPTKTNDARRTIAAKNGLATTK